eukprot:CAMPEP_0175792012 /NCGR_PEP_ID=MMETSP0097-20121207/82749_1 /TAXON_ID=311494 /ORGANISM="Alexandrium monilatum, Strain CCMP3105" /LENGTH=42 /DNA_ID= /DNA_START= /DNA_END= /DNA_ORIENTATION=
MPRQARLPVRGLTSGLYMCRSRSTMAALAREALRCSRLDADV